MRRENNGIKTFCMLSTHGYFDPVPILGRTDTGGQVVYVLELAKSLSKQNINVDIYTRWFDQSQEQVDPVPDFPDVRVIRIPAGPWEFIPKEQIYEVLPDLAKNMAGFIREHALDYDFYHGHYVDAGIVCLDVAQMFDRPAFFTAHSIGAWKREQMGGDPEKMEKKFNFKLRTSEELRIFKSVQAQTFTTYLQQEKVKELYGFSADNTKVIPPGVNVHNFKPRKPGEKKIDTGLPDKYIFCLSRIDSNKGHDLLLNAFDLVRNDQPDAQLVIGGGSPEPKLTEKEVIASIKKIIHDKNLDKQVHVIGYIPDNLLVPIYQQCAMFVLPSTFEPFGMTALEAMASARPVIASDRGGIKNVITSGKNGILIDPSDAGEFSEAMVSLLIDTDYGETIGENGLGTIHEHFSWEAIGRQYLTFYEHYL